MTLSVLLCTYTIIIGQKIHAQHVKYEMPLNHTLLSFSDKSEITRSDIVESRPINKNKTCANDAMIITELLKNYDKHKIPGGSNVQVSVEIWVQEISKIIEITSEFELDIYVTEKWIDPSLAYSHMNPCKKNMSVDGGKILPQIWNPHACFVNSKDASIHRSPFSNIFLQIYSDGNVWHNYRIKLTGPCFNALRTFPIDKQRCMLFYESFNHNYDQVSLSFFSSFLLLILVF
ncbi:unnamed protein product [Brugia timori]|uniref:Neur_chan_LBD domain-containing protein n=1 Tax=Brugia timori TaxID=42155 RepID=A0A0R3RAR9_9BILA|nr:unnamed protein product [Brugia timori]